MGIPIPFALRSPSPRIRPPSVTQMKRTSFWGQRAAEQNSCAALDSVIDLSLNKLEGAISAQGSKRRLVIGRIARDELRQLALEAAQELVSHLLLKDETLGTHAALAGVVHATKDGPFDRLVHVSIVEDDVGITPSEFHGCLPESLACFSS